MKYVTRTVWILSVISLLNDISSEMLYPVLPLFLQAIGFNAAMMGALEGLAEATVGMSKGYFGAMSDARGRRLPFVRLGYFLSGISKPMMALWSFPAWIFAARSADKLGKGIRTASRDAILSDEATHGTKGRVFGFHRTMDTLGAAVGPSLALVLIYFFPGQYRMMFLISVIPVMIGVGLTYLMREREHAPHPERQYTILAVFTYFRDSTPAFRRLTIGILLFSLFNSSDLFLLMRIKAATHNDQYVIGAYIFYNLVYALASLPLGAAGDRFGLRPTYIVGLFLFAGVYALIAIGSSMTIFACAFLLYGLYSAATEGISKALVTSLVPASETASAIGSLSGLTSLMALAASILTGIMWDQVSATIALLVSASGALVAAVYLMIVRIEEPRIKTAA